LAVDQFTGLEVRHTFTPRGVSGWRRVYPDLDLDWETEENAFAFRAIRQMAEAGDEIYSAHQRLVGLARTRLGL
jgi:hypothetical protein